VELQELAGEALVAFMAALPAARRAAAASTFLKQLVATKLPKRVPAPAAGAGGGGEGEAEAAAAHRAYKAALAKALRQRHGAAIGAASVVKAHPFDVPDFLPPVLAALARHATDAAPVGPTVKKAIAEFRATHSDGWEQHKAAFTEEQLADVMASGSGASCE
jgi:proteasome activator subunit 4